MGRTRPISVFGGAMMPPMPIVSPTPVSPGTVWPGHGGASLEKLGFQGRLMGSASGLKGMATQLTPAASARSDRPRRLEISWPGATPAPSAPIGCKPLISLGIVPPHPTADRLIPFPP